MGPGFHKYKQEYLKFTNNMGLYAHILGKTGIIMGNFTKILGNIKDKTRPKGNFKNKVT